MEGAEESKTEEFLSGNCSFENQLENARKFSYTFNTQPLETDLRKLLKQVTGKTDPENITEVRLKVVSSQAGLHRLSNYTPSLKILILDGSCIASFRDLGSSLNSLTTLSVARCNLKHLDGVWGFRNLEELNARDNLVSDPSPCSGVKKLSKLDLRNNELTEVSYFAFLRSCRRLRELRLADNNFSEYKEEIKNFIPQLKILDGKRFEDSFTQPEAASEDDLVSNNENPSSEDESFTSLLSSEENIEFEETNMLKEKEEMENAEISSSFVQNREDQPPNSSANDSDANNAVNDKSTAHETTSGKLSSGRVICGNLAVSLRARNPTKNSFSLTSCPNAGSFKQNSNYSQSEGGGGGGGRGRGKRRRKIRRRGRKATKGISRKNGN